MAVMLSVMGFIIITQAVINTMILRKLDVMEQTVKMLNQNGKAIELEMRVTEGDIRLIKDNLKEFHRRGGFY